MLVHVTFVSLVDVGDAIISGPWTSVPPLVAPSRGRLGRVSSAFHPNETPRCHIGLLVLTHDRRQHKSFLLIALHRYLYYPWFDGVLSAYSGWRPINVRVTWHQILVVILVDRGYDMVPLPLSVIS
jgi:hypothetical protein